jgi:flagellin
MALNSINTNIAAYFAQQNINSANSSVSSSVGRLSSGNRIVRASDDVAAMSVGTSLRTTVTTLKMGLLNASQGSSMLQVADGALGKVQDMLLRQKALATQSTSGSLTGAERGFLNQEFQNLTQEIDRLVQNTNFNGVNLLGGGLGTTSLLASTNTLATGFGSGAGNTQSLAQSAFAVDAVDARDGSVFAAAAAGSVSFVETDGTTPIADEDFLQINKGVYGKFENFQSSNLIEGVSLDVSVEVNGITFTGTYVDADTDVVVSNGNTRMLLTMTAAITLTDQGTANAGIGELRQDYANSVIQRTSLVQDIDFSGTRLMDVVGTAGNGGISMVRVNDPSRLDIGNFQYISNGGADANVLTVQVNGQTFTATGVNDNVTDGYVLMFEGGDGQGLQIDLTGLATGDQLEFTNIRTDLAEREDLINSLNIGFSKAGSGVDFALGTERTDSLRVQISSASSVALYNGASLNISTVANAQEAGEALNGAIDMVTSIRADVGAMMSRFDFATANIEIAMQNQDAARGTLLDTDVAAESSAYATAQVQLQAGIAVLAQANQLPQNLLKLIG